MFEGEGALALAAAAARTGYLSLPWVITTAAVGALLGDQLAFIIGRLCGLRLAARLPRLAAAVTRMEGLLERHGAMIVIGRRFAYGFRIPAAMAIGMSGMSWMRFGTLTLIGTCLWAALFASGGYVAGWMVLALV